MNKLLALRVEAVCCGLVCCGMAQALNPEVAVLQQLLQKYKGCILERYETQQDMVSRRLPAADSGLANTNGLQARDAIACTAGNTSCIPASGGHPDTKVAMAYTNANHRPSRRRPAGVEGAVRNRATGPVAESAAARRRP